MLQSAGMNQLKGITKESANVRKVSFKIADDDKREHKSTNLKIIKPIKRFGVTGAGRLHCPWPYRSNCREIEAVPATPWRDKSKG